MNPQLEVVGRSAGRCTSWKTKGKPMYIVQTDVVGGMRKEFVNKFMASTMKVSCSKGDFLYRQGDPAHAFYILLNGRVKLVMGANGTSVHMVGHAGEAFGWSSLIGLQVHSASAECLESTTLLKINREAFQAIVEKDPADGLIFFKRLARTLGTHLIRCYQERTTTSSAAVSPSMDAMQTQRKKTDGER